jgi:hypothetical protein
MVPTTRFLVAPWRDLGWYHLKRVSEGFDRQRCARQRVVDDADFIDEATVRMIEISADR